MSSAEKFESLSLLPDRLSVAEFEPETVDKLLGPTPESQELARENFNWLAAYLVEEVGLFENEVSEWFLSGAKGLGGKTPLAAWNKPDGFMDVFDYTQAYKQKVDEALAEEGVLRQGYLFERSQSHDIARSALNVILPALMQVAGVSLRPAKVPGLQPRQAIWNPAKQDRLIVSWKGNGELEDYRVTIKGDEGESTYYIVRALLPDEPPLILQSGIIETFRGETDLYAPSTSDIDGRPPSAGEVAAFVIPVANEMKNHSLALITA